MLGLGLSLWSVAQLGGGKPPVFQPVALVTPTTGAAWVTPDGKLLVTMQEAQDA